MPLRVIEGTWEEIKRHEAELMGQYLRVTIKPPKAMTRKPSESAQKAATSDQPKKLSAFGAFKGVFGGSEEFAKEKRLEIEREDRAR
jgi:hypothetical protein